MNSIVLSTTIPASSTSPVVITGAGFTPKAALLLYAVPTVDGTTIGLASGVGFASASAQAAASFRSLAARTTTSQSRSMIASTSNFTVWNNVGTVIGQCSVASLDSDGITLSVGTAFSADVSVSVLLLGGSDLTASVGTFQIPSATGAFTAVSGLAHQPNVVLVASANRSATTVNTVASVTPGLAFGYATASAQANVSIPAQSAGSASESVEAWVATDALLVNDNGSSGLQERVTFTAFTSDGFTANKTANNGTTGGQVAYLALTVPQVATGTTAARTDTGTTTITTTGITPRALIAIARPPATAADTTAATGTNDGQGNIGIASGPSNRASLSFQVLEVTTIGGGTPTETYNRLATDAFHTHYSRSASNTYTLDGALDVQSFGTDSITLVQDDADTVASVLPYLILGDTASTGTFRPWFAL